MSWKQIVLNCERQLTIDNQALNPIFSLYKSKLTLN